MIVELIKSGKKVTYLHSDDELEQYREEHGGNYTVKRFKGLGEMNPRELWQTTMDPDKRILKLIEIRSDLDADNVFSTLMGSDVSARRDWIWENSDKITALDI